MRQCTYPRCNCLVQTSTSNPKPTCPKPEQTVYVLVDTAGIVQKEQSLDKNNNPAMRIEQLWAEELKNPEYRLFVGVKGYA